MGMNYKYGISKNVSVRSITNLCLLFATVLSVMEKGGVTAGHKAAALLWTVCPATLRSSNSR
jgi:hypothetical protein